MSRGPESITRELTPPLRVLIADDERLGRERLKRFLRSEPGLEIVAECASGREALEAIRRQAPEVAFLDIQMPEMDAFSVLSSLRDERCPAIILVTAHEQFALRGFEVDAVDYLLKPFNRRRFRAALERLRRRLRLEPPLAPATSPATSRQGDDNAQRPLDRLKVRSAGRITLVKASDISWISAADNYSELHVGQKTHLLRVSLSTLAQSLDQNRFARISRFVLVNQDQIREIHSKAHGDFRVVLANGTSLPGSRNYRAGVAGLRRG